MGETPGESKIIIRAARGDCGGTFGKGGASYERCARCSLRGYRCDYNVYVFYYYHGKATSRLTQMAVDAASRYDLVFVCDTDIPYADTWDRSGEVQRFVFQKQIIADLKMRQIPYFLLKGTLEERAESLSKILKPYRKYRSLSECLMMNTASGGGSNGNE